MVADHARRTDVQPRLKPSHFDEGNSVFKCNSAVEYYNSTDPNYTEAPTSFYSSGGAIPGEIKRRLRRTIRTVASRLQLVRIAINQTAPVSPTFDRISLLLKLTRESGSDHVGERADDVIKRPRSDKTSCRAERLTYHTANVLCHIRAMKWKLFIPPAEDFQPGFTFRIRRNARRN